MRKSSLPTHCEEFLDNKEPSSNKEPSASKKPSVSGCHDIFWWSLKVVCGALLNAGLFIAVIYSLTPWFDFPRAIAQSLVVTGGLSAIYHYWQLKSVNRTIEQPQVLETEKGLYPFVRHPMHLADFLSYTGLLLLFLTISTMAVLVLGFVALVQQSKVENHYLADHFGKLADRFGKLFERWETRSN